jgi:hypothetical protein
MERPIRVIRQLNTTCTASILATIRQNASSCTLRNGSRKVQNLLKRRKRKRKIGRRKIVPTTSLNRRIRRAMNWLA